MARWPPEDQESVYVPPAVPAPELSEVEQRAELAAARVREGLAIDDATLAEIIEARGSDPGAGIYTAAERDDISHDSERVQSARELLVDASGVFGGLEVCWVHGRRGVRVLLTAELDRFRRLLASTIGADRVVVEKATMTERELDDLQDQIHAQMDDLAARGVFLTMFGNTTISYLAWDPDAARALLRERFGDSITLCYQGASNRTFSAMPFGSWHAEENRLHVFYGLPFNGERPGFCHALEDERAVVVALSIEDWRGAKTLIGGFTPSHATVLLDRPLGDRVVIDDSADRVRPHWTQATAGTTP